jgi:hypothetical protein
MDNKTNQELQSLTFERLFNHLRERKDVQNIDLMNLSWFCKTVYLNDIRKKLIKKVLKFQISMQENMCMECLILNGRKNIKNNYFSLRRGNNSTKLQGL